MNKTLYFVALVLLRCIAAMAQQTNGIATYEVRMNHNPGSFKLSEEDRQKLPVQVQLQIQASMASATQTAQLDFDGQQAWYHALETPANEQQSGGTKLAVSTRMEGSGQDIYRDLAAKSQVSVAVFSGKTYLIAEPVTPLPWKLLDETRSIAGHTCYKATLPGEPVRRIINGKEDQLPAVEIVAWYAKDIPVPQGPSRYFGLPGLILQVDEGFRSILCTSIDFDTLHKAIPKAPTSGQAISKPEFEALREAYVKKMMGVGNGNSGVRVQED